MCGRQCAGCQAGRGNEKLCAERFAGDQTRDCAEYGGYGYARPEIDYTITPRSFSSTLGTHRFKPASVTYWEYMKEYSFYMKLGVGYPLNSVADVYASTHRADVGYIMGYVNHRGQYSKIRMTDLFDGSSYRNNSQQMVNRVGVNAGKYFGRYTLSGDIYYQSDIYHRYPLAARLRPPRDKFRGREPETSFRRFVRRFEASELRRLRFGRFL